MYTLLKFLHVLSAVVGVGANLTYPVLLARAHREPAHLAHVLETIRALDRRVAMPAYAAVLLTGLLLLLTGPIAITASWVWISLTLYVVIAVIGATALAPAMGTMRQTLAAGGHESAAYRRAQARAYRLIAVATTLVVVILYLMVAKP
jgi:uncharacterized membrane protein